MSEIEESRISVENEINTFIDQFEDAYYLFDDTFTDPVWDEGTYSVLKHKSELTYIYMRPDGSRVIEFIVFADDSAIDYVYYFPKGL